MGHGYQTQVLLARQALDQLSCLLAQWILFEKKENCNDPCYSGRSSAGFGTERQRLSLVLSLERSSWVGGDGWEMTKWKHHLPTPVGGFWLSWPNRIARRQSQSTSLQAGRGETSSDTAGDQPLGVVLPKLT